VKESTKRQYTESSFESWRINHNRTLKAEEEKSKAQTQEKQSDASDFLRTGTGHLSLTGKKAQSKVVKEMDEVRRIFNQFDQDHSGALERNEFVDLLARLMRTPKSEMDMAEVWHHWDNVDTDGGGSITFDEFQTWYCDTFKVEGNPDYTDFFTKDVEVDECELMVRNTARDLGMAINDIEKLWKDFQRLDINQNGTLEFEEFKVLIEKQLKPTTGKAGEVPTSIHKKFWNEIDKLGKGAVAFPEFAQWYTSFFQDDSISPMEQYYKDLAKGPGSFRRAM